MMNVGAEAAKNIRNAAEEYPAATTDTLSGLPKKVERTAGRKVLPAFFAQTVKRQK